MDEQVAISISLEEGSRSLSFEIINEITGATGYRVIISTESNMESEFWQFDLFNSMVSDYPSNAPILEFGTSYYVTAQALDGNELHGIISNIVGFFISNITPPLILSGNEFSWEATIPSPPEDEYFLEVSLVEDFSVPIISTLVKGTIYPINMSELEYGKGYYWRVQGLDAGNVFGGISQVGYFETEEVPSAILNISSEELSLNPEFNWDGIELASAYQIIVSSAYQKS